MSRSLPNHYSNINADSDPRAPSSQRIKSNMGPYPGGMPGITPNYINNDKLVNKSVGLNTNGSIRTTVQTRSRDQNYVNVNQLAFIDTKIPERPLMMNIQQLNWWFVEHGIPLFEQGKVQQEWSIIDFKQIPANLDQAEKGYIMKRFKLYGAVVNRDVDTENMMPIERQPRAFTCTVKGVCHLLDYWSTEDRTLRAYDQCYFVLKKVLVGPDTKFQARLNSSLHNTGTSVPAGWPKVGQMVWQIVPWHTSNNYIPVEIYSWTDKNSLLGVMVDGKTHVGGYWRIGNIHEYPDIGHRSQYKKRKDLSVAQDVTYLHDNGRVVPIHFYLKLDTNCN